jgi:hypothetical protein
MSQYLITGRDKSNSKFRYEDYPTGNNSIIINELTIIILIRRGHLFYTKSPDGTLTEVTVHNGHLRSVNNKTKIDNLQNLPLI